MTSDHLSSGDLVVGQDEQGAQELGGVGGVHADFGQDAPVLQVREAVLDGCAFAADQPVDLLLGGGEWPAAGGFAAGDDDGVVGVIVQTDEAEVGDGAESGTRRPSPPGHPPLGLSHTLRHRVMVVRRR
jgi:hypothetical protein